MGVRGAGGVSGILDWDADDPLLSCERGASDAGVSNYA